MTRWPRPLSVPACLDLDPNDTARVQSHNYESAVQEGHRLTVLSHVLPVTCPTLVERSPMQFVELPDGAE